MEKERNKSGGPMKGEGGGGGGKLYSLFMKIRILSWSVRGGE